MRKQLIIAPLLLAALSIGCGNQTATGPGVVTITETTTTTTTTTIPVATTASFVYSPLTPEAEQIVYFDASGSKPGTGRTIVSYNWDFGDGMKKTGITSTHDFTPSGVYLVTLTVVDDAGNKATNSQTITVRPKTPPTT